MEMAATAKTSARAKALNELNGRKDDYPFTKRLSDQQFNSLTGNEKKFLMIEWDFHVEASILCVTGGARARDYNLIAPPPNVFAGSEDFKINMKWIGKWWTKGRQQQLKAIEWYRDKIGLSEKLKYQRNINIMLEAQQLFFQKKAGLCSESTGCIELSIASHEKEDNMDEVRSISNCQDEEENRSPEFELCDANHEEDPIEFECDSEEENQRNKRNNDARRVSIEEGDEGFSVVMHTTPSAHHDRRRSRLHSPLDIARLQIQQPNVINREDEEEEIGYRGLFSQDIDDEATEIQRGSKTAKAKKMGSHIACTKTMNKIYSAMKSIGSFIQFTENSNEVMMNCNDMFLVYVRNVELTSKEGGVQPIKRLGGSRQIATVVCRSEAHFKKMLRVFIPAIRARELGDEKFIDIFDCEYVFPINDGANAIEGYIAKLEEGQQ